VEYLEHDTLTDVISFDYSVGNEINGDCFISVESELKITPKILMSHLMKGLSVSLFMDCCIMWVQRQG
jgi:hypothetical protein